MTGRTHGRSATPSRRSGGGSAAPSGGPNVIGISANFHDSACCVLNGGRLVAAAQEERFSRIKNDAAFPKQALRHCLSAAGLTIADIDCVAFYEDPTKKLARQIWSGQVDAAFGDPHRFNATRPARQIREIFGFEGPIEFVDHHASHAASSYYFSGFPDAAVLTVVGVGEWATTTYGHARGTRIDIFEEVEFPDSLGLLYSAMTSYLGFKVNNGEYKVMGLAPYGEPKYVDKLRCLVRIGPRGQYSLDGKYFDFTDRKCMYTDALPQLFGEAPRQPGGELTRFHRDVARSLQVTLEEILLAKTRYLRDRVASENLCMAGGVALNCVANGKILRSGLFERVYVPPACDDAGGALGAAAVAHLRRGGDGPKREPLMNACLGPAYSNDDAQAVLRDAQIPASDFRGREDELIVATVERLVAGKVVGWFHGRMEFGPRALGARSILADPRCPRMRDKVNSRVKERESFRPFAPSVLASHTQDHFDIDRPSPFMLFVCKVTSDLELPAITHIDGSARLQTVHPDTSPRYAALIEAFRQRTGCPLILNTSFNMSEEPIVCHPAEALQCFMRSGLDSLVLEDFVIDRSDLPAATCEYVRRAGYDNRPVVGHDAYTFW